MQFFAKIIQKSSNYILFLVKMDTTRPCGCKGCRTCLICEKSLDIKPKEVQLDRNQSYVYCPFCNKAWPGWDINIYKAHPNHEGTPIEYPGMFIQMDFLTDQEEKELLTNLDTKIEWDLSQSGRRKQNFGPKCNFKKRKLRLGDFNGFPQFSEFVQDRFKEVDILKDFQTIEQCSLEYDASRGASIDPHIDDCWIWGERVVTVNLLSDSVLTMTINDKPERYNLDCVREYPTVLVEGKVEETSSPYLIQLKENRDYPIVRVPMPKRSLLVMYGAARYDWEHQVLREDIDGRRVCLAYREFTPPYLKGGEFYAESEAILERAKHFW